MANIANASYFRFWRGQMMPTSSYHDFQIGLNSIFVPATGKLISSVAKLNSYHPFLVDESMSKSEGVPTEMALVEYESENSYQAFRATPEGKQYGELHWDYFDKKNSKSLVPQQYVGQQIEFENAYSFTRSSNLSFMNGIPFFQIIKRTGELTNTQWKEIICKHLEYVVGDNVNSVIFLATQNYVIEYTTWDSINEKEESDNNIRSIQVELGKTLVNKQLQPGRLLSPGSGIRFN